MDISLHNCEDMSIHLHMPDNANAIILAIKRENGDHVHMTLYNLPPEMTERMINAFGPPRRTKFKLAEDNVESN